MMTMMNATTLTMTPTARTTRTKMHWHSEAVSLLHSSQWQALGLSLAAVAHRRPFRQSPS